MRLFIAIQFPKYIETKIKTFFYPLNALTLNTKLLNTKKIKMNKHIHLTLKFLGEVEENYLKNIIEKLNEINITPFTLNIENIGGFPKLNENSKIIWTGIKYNPKLQKLIQNINSKMQQLNFPKENKNSIPHITIFRAKHKIPKTITDYLIKNNNAYFAKTKIKTFYLMESKLKKQGAIYREIHKFNL